MPTPDDSRLQRILLIEDDDDTRRLIRRSLGPRFEIIEAINGSEALALCEEVAGGNKDPFDFVIQDLRLPGRDESLTDLRLVLRVMGTLGLDVPVAIISGGDLNLVRESGIFHVLPKPFTPVALRKLVSDMQAVENRSVELIVPGQLQGSPRPWWISTIALALCGFGLTTGSLSSLGYATMPTEIWVASAAFSFLLAWVGPVPADTGAGIWRIIAKILGKTNK